MAAQRNIHKIVKGLLKKYKVSFTDPCDPTYVGDCLCSGAGTTVDSYLQAFIPGTFVGSSITVLAATHGQGINPTATVYEGTLEVMPDTLSVNASGDVTFTVTPGLEFTGKVIITA